MNVRHGLGIPAVVLLVLLTFDSGGSCWAEAAVRLTLQESVDQALQQSVMIHASREGVKGAEAQRRRP